MNNTQIVVLICTNVLFLIITYISLKAKRLHAIPRFFAFESILILTLLNFSVWFDKPFSWNQIISWILLIVSIIYAVSGFYLLYRFGKPKGSFENTTKLVFTGLYKYIRHPLYGSLLFLGIGIFLKEITLTTTTLALINLIALIFTAKIEEQEMLKKFGSEFYVYIQKTKLFVPRLF